MRSSPGLAAELGAKGGRRRAVVRPDELTELPAPETAGDLRDLQTTSVVEIRKGLLDPRMANAIGYLDGRRASNSVKKFSTFRNSSLSLALSF